MVLWKKIIERIMTIFTGTQWEIVQLFLRNVQTLSIYFFIYFFVLNHNNPWAINWCKIWCGMWDFETHELCIRIFTFWNVTNINCDLSYSLFCSIVFKCCGFGEHFKSCIQIVVWYFKGVLWIFFSVHACVILDDIWCLM